MILVSVHQNSMRTIQNKSKCFVFPEFYFAGETKELMVQIFKYEHIIISPKMQKSCLYINLCIS